MKPIIIATTILMAVAAVATPAAGQCCTLGRTNLPKNLSWLDLEGEQFGLQVQAIVTEAVPDWQGERSGELFFAAKRVWVSPGVQDRFWDQNSPTYNFLVLRFVLETAGREAAVLATYDEYNRITVELLSVYPIGQMPGNYFYAVPLGSACDRANDKDTAACVVRRDGSVLCKKKNGGSKVYYYAGDDVYEAEDGERIKKCENDAGKEVFVYVKPGDDECDGCGDGSGSGGTGGTGGTGGSGGGWCGGIGGLPGDGKP